MPLPAARALRYCIDDGASPLDWAGVIRLWQCDSGFRAFFIALLQQAPFHALRWETPALTRMTLNQPFEFVLLDSPDLAVAPDPSAFAEHFDGADDGDIVEFPNLGGDAVLVAPCPSQARSDYGHLAAFLRNAPAAQQHALWQAVAAAVQRRVGSRPLWLSSAGGGVPWLHLRLDDRPKYYHHAPYRIAG